MKFSLLKNFRFVQSDENFLCKNSLPYIANIWRALEVDENNVTRKFLTQIFCERNIRELWYNS